jgi:hypothetical protein
LQGVVIDLAEYRGRPVLVYFFSSAMPQLRKTGAYTAFRLIMFLTTNTELLVEISATARNWDCRGERGCDNDGQSKPAVGTALRRHR